MKEFDNSTITEEREKTYRFLAGICLKSPSDSLIDMIKDKSILLLFPEDTDCESYNEISRFINETAEIKNISDQIAAEHASLFSLPSNHLPHEAVYRDKEKRLGGKVTMDVSQFYEKAGASILNSCIEMPDHLGMELEFMGFLCKMERELRENADYPSLDNCIYLQKTFIDEHLIKWVYPCCEKIVERSTYGFYKAIAHMITEFIKSEDDYLKELYLKIEPHTEPKVQDMLTS